MKRFAMTLAALGLVGTAISPAFANQTERTTIQVRYDDINLAAPKGQQQFDRRIEKAVKTVCHTQRFKGGSRILNSDARACLAKARADVRQQVAALNKGKQRGG